MKTATREWLGLVTTVGRLNHVGRLDFHPVKRVIHTVNNAGVRGGLQTGNRISQTLPIMMIRGVRTVSSDVLLFKDDRKQFYILLSFGASLIGAAAIFNGITFYRGSAAMSERFDKAKASVVPDLSTWWRRYKARLFNMVSGEKIRIGVTGFMCLFGAACLGIAILIPLKCIHRLHLLQGGTSISVTTFGPFGIQRNYKFRVDDVTSSVTRQAYHSAIPLKVKGHYTGFSMDNRNGKFLNGPLFDEVVSIRRIFKKD